MSFRVLELSEEQIFVMLAERVWKEDCPLHYTRLKRLEVSHRDFKGKKRTGELIVLDEVAEQVLSIFRELFELGFPIQQMVPVEEFSGDDVKSMAANNSSAFNGRKVMNTDRWSSHAFGVAIDVNPGQNPYLVPDRERSTIQVYPPQAIDFVNRGFKKPGMVEEIVPIFAKHGFTEWGGNWNHTPDYHHFQLPWDEIEKLFPGLTAGA